MCISFSCLFLQDIPEFPPRIISVPRPAMFVAIVTALYLPACAIISASFSWYFAFNTWCGIFALSNNLLIFLIYRLILYLLELVVLFRNSF